MHKCTTSPIQRWSGTLRQKRSSASQKTCDRSIVYHHRRERPVRGRKHEPPKAPHDVGTSANGFLIKKGHVSSYSRSVREQAAAVLRSRLGRTGETGRAIRILLQLTTDHEPRVPDIIVAGEEVGESYQLGVALNGDRVVQAAIVFRDARGQLVTEVPLLAVDREVAARGLGTCCVDLVKCHATSHGSRYVVAASCGDKKTVGYWRSQGFQPAGADAERIVRHTYQAWSDTVPMIRAM